MIHRAGPGPRRLPGIVAGTEDSHMQAVMHTVLIFIAAIFGLGAGFWLGWALNNRQGSHSLKRAQGEASIILEDAKLKSEQMAKLAMARAQEEALAEREALEEEYQKKFESAKNIERAMNRRDAQLKVEERELKDQEEALQLERDGLQAQRDALALQEGVIESQVQEYNAKLERVAGLTQEDAKRLLLSNMKSEAEYAAANLIRQIKEDAQRTAEQEALKIVTLAIERVTVDQVVERTTTQFRLPDEGIKGRLIGHEGQNIKLFEELTGMQLLMRNEDPNTVMISGFNPVSREVARQALEKLLQGGKIHPLKIQEAVGKARKRVNREMQTAGDDAFKYLQLDPPHPEIVGLVGKLRYRTSYGQNVLNHSIEVAELAGSMAAELGLDVQLARRAGLLHDLGKAIDFEREGTHPELGGQAARVAGEHEVVVNAIESHHEDVEVIHPISILVAVADSMSGGRPGARRASLADYAKRIETLESLVNSFEGVEQAFAIQAGREVRVIVKADRVSDARMPFLAGEMTKKIQEEMDYPGRVKVTMIREMKAVEYAG